MRPSRTPETFANSTPAPWMKWVFVAEAAVFLLAAIVIWDLWETAQGELAASKKQLKAKTEERDGMRREQDNTLAYLGKFENDPEFKLREGRQRLGFAQPGEVVFRLEPPAKTESTPAAK